MKMNLLKKTVAVITALVLGFAMTIGPVMAVAPGLGSYAAEINPFGIINFDEIYAARYGTHRFGEISEGNRTTPLDATNMVSQEIVRFEGIPILFTMFNHNGTIVETASLLEETNAGLRIVQSGESTASLARSAVQEQQLMEAINRRLGGQDANMSPAQAAPRSGNIFFISGTVDNAPFFNTAHSTPAGARVEYFGSFSGRTMIFLLGLYTHATANVHQAVVIGSPQTFSVAESITINETISRLSPGWNFGFTLPPGISFGVGANRDVAHRSVTMNNVLSLSAWQPHIGGTWHLPFMTGFVADLMTISASVTVVTRQGLHGFAHTATTSITYRAIG